MPRVERAARRVSSGAAFVAAEAGFLYLEVSVTELTGRFINVDGNVVFERTK